MKIEGEEISEVVESGGCSIRSREQWFEAHSFSELRYHLSLGKPRRKVVEYVRTVVSLVPFALHSSRSRWIGGIWVCVEPVSYLPPGHHCGASQSSHSLRSTSTSRASF